MLSELRKSNGLSQLDVAQRLGVGQSTVAMWENGTNVPRVDKLIALATLYGCSVDDLLSAVATTKASK